MQFRLYTLGGIPVHISVWVLGLIAYVAITRLDDPVAGIFGGLGLLISVLIHEYGHALVAARYGLTPSITLQMFGGYTLHQPAKTDAQDAFILVSGAALQLLSSLVFYLAWIAFDAVAPGVSNHPYFVSFGYTFLFVGIFWAIVNLLPMWPLDGGKLFRLGLIHLLKVKPVPADKATHIAGIVGHTLLILAFWLVLNGGNAAFFVMILFGFMIFQNVQALRSGRAAGPIRRTNEHAKSLIQEARDAFKAENWREAARIGHQIRAEAGVPDKTLDEVFEIIALSHIFDGKLEEGARFARRAPNKPHIVAAQVQALIALDKADEARSVLKVRGQNLPEDLRAKLETELG
ncbi:MAG: site-2 protease family protein [Myxococcota bacterium]